MRPVKLLLIALIWLAIENYSLAQIRVVISTDFPPLDVCMSGCPADRMSDPDDIQSMIRFMLYANEFQVEGLVASSATFANIAKKQNILDLLDLYDKVDDNLRKYDIRYPTADYYRSVTFQGLSGTWGKSLNNNIGKEKDSEASDAIIKIVDNPDTRPVWFCVWGDCSNIAQAVWKIKNTRSDTELKTFLGKIRIHQIAHQDDTIDWLLNNFPDLFIIYSRTTYQGMFGGSDSISNLAWVNENIRNNHGPLCDVYPHEGIGCTGVCEGDSPSFLHLVSANRGLNNPEDPTQESWGGQSITRLGWLTFSRSFDDRKLHWRIGMMNKKSFPMTTIPSSLLQFLPLQILSSLVTMLM